MIYVPSFLYFMIFIAKTINAAQLCFQILVFVLSLMSSDLRYEILKLQLHTVNAYLSMQEIKRERKRTASEITMISNIRLLIRDLAQDHTNNTVRYILVKWPRQDLSNKTYIHCVCFGIESISLHLNLTGNRCVCMYASLTVFS